MLSGCFINFKYAGLVAAILMPSLSSGYSGDEEAELGAVYKPSVFPEDAISQLSDEELTRVVYSPPVQNKTTNLLWGDTHLHTSLSVDAYLRGTRLTRDIAYRFAQGQVVTADNGLKVQLRRPLDFLAVADHASQLLSRDMTLISLAGLCGMWSRLQLRRIKGSEFLNVLVSEQPIGGLRNGTANQMNFLLVCLLLWLAYRRGVAGRLLHLG